MMLEGNFKSIKTFHYKEAQNLQNGHEMCQAYYGYFCSWYSSFPREPAVTICLMSVRSHLNEEEVPEWC